MNLNNYKNILIISPHPDDETIGCGGLIMLAKKNNLNVFVYYMCLGFSRQYITGSTSAKTRIPEIKNASQYGNFKYSIAFQGKEFMRLDAVPQKKLIEKIEDCIEKIQPDIVTMPTLSSYDQDHRATTTAAITALRPIPPEIRHQPKIILTYPEPYTWDIGESFKPNVFIDISSVQEEKISLVKCHTSQVRKDPYPRSPENLTRLAGFWGTQIGVQYAEAYQLLKGIL